MSLTRVWFAAEAYELFEETVLEANPDLCQMIVDADNGNLPAILTIASHCAKGKLVKAQSWPNAL